MFDRIVSAALLIVASPAAAQVTSMESNIPRPAPKLTGNPDRIICEKVERLGSRLAVDKVCMTAREWADQREGHREDLERVQQVVNQEPSDPH